MIIEITRGDDPVGLVAYLLGQAHDLREGAELVSVENLVSIETAPLEMRAVFQQSDRCKSPILHVSVSLAPGEHLSDSEWREAWAGIDALLQMPDHQKVTVRHNEKDHQHQHRAYNIVSPDSFATPPARHWHEEERRFLEEHEIGELDGSERKRAWDTFLKYRLQRLARHLEHALGLANANAQDRWGSRDRGKDAPSHGARAREERTGATPLIDRGVEIRKALRLPDWASRSEALNEIGVGMRPYVGKNQHRKGIVLYALDDPENAIAGSALGSDYALGALERSAGQQLDGFLAGVKGQQKAATTRRPHDPLKAAYRDYLKSYDVVKADWDAEYQQLSEALKAERDRLIRRQQMERKNLLASAFRHHRQMLRDSIAIRVEAEHAKLARVHGEMRKNARSTKPKRLDWKAWLEVQASSGNAAAQERIGRMQRRGPSAGQSQLRQMPGFRPIVGGRDR